MCNLIHANEKRLSAYVNAAEKWKFAWKSTEAACAGLPLRLAHEKVLAAALPVLPFNPEASHA